MKMLAAAVALATLAVAAPALAEGDNPITNAVKDNHMMWTGRYELPGQRSYDRVVRRDRYVAPRAEMTYGYPESDGYYEPGYRYRPAYGYPSNDGIYGDGVRYGYGYNYLD